MQRQVLYHAEMRNSLLQQNILMITVLRVYLKKKALFWLSARHQKICWGSFLTKESSFVLAPFK